MRALFLTFALLLFPLAVRAQQPGHFDVRMAIVDIHVAQTGYNRTLLLGDSNTEAFYWVEFNNDACLVVNAGFGGARIQQIAERAPQIFASSRPRVAHVMVGTNNLYLSQTSSEWALMPAHLHAIAEAAAPYGTKLIWWPVPPMSQAGAPADYLAKRAALNAMIQAEAGASGGLLDWWWHQQITDANGYAVAGSMRGDGVHFSATTQSSRHARLGVWAQQPGVGC